MNLNIHAGVGAGRFRQPWRIREYLDAQGTSMAEVARKLGVDHSLVSRTVSGVMNNRRVLAYLRELGCPTDDLSLPADMLKGE